MTFKKKETVKFVKNRMKSINILHLFILVVISFAFIALFKYFSGTNDWITVRVEAKAKNWTENFDGQDYYRPPNWVLPYLEENLIEYNNSGEKMAIISNIESYDRNKTVKIFFDAKLKIIKNNNTKQLIYKNNPIQIGSLINFSLPGVLMVGEIIEIAPVSEKKTLIIKTKNENLQKWIADEIEVGDTMKELTSEKTIARIIEKKLEPTVSQIFLAPSYGSPTFLQNNPRLTDLILTIEIEVDKKDDYYFFAGNQLVRKTEFIEFSFDDYKLYWSQILEIDEK